MPPEPLIPVVIPALPPTLVGSRVRLRGLRADDAPAWFAHVGDPVVIEHTSFPAQSLESVQRMLERAQQAYSDRAFCDWALTTLSDDQLIGTCGFNNFAPEQSRAELAYDLAPPHWGKGLMGEAVGLVLDWAFTTVGFNRVQAVVMITNDRSRRVVERAGFRREGLLRSYRVARGVPRDFYMYSLLRKEWTRA